MLDFIRISIIVIGSLGIFLNLLNSAKQTSFDKLINVALGILGLDALLSLLTDRLFPEEQYFDTAVPFGLIYGPLLFFGFLHGSGDRPGFRKVIWHCLPFGVAFSCYAFLLMSQSIRSNFLSNYLWGLYGVVPISYLGYSIWCFLYKGIDRVKNFQGGQKVLYFSSAILFVGAMFFITVLFTKSPDTPSYHYPVVFINVLMLLATGILMTYNLFRGRDLKTTEATPEKPAGEAAGAKKSLYQKAALPQKLLNSYRVFFLEVLENEKLYLQSDFSLVNLSLRMKVPTHHLSQMINLSFGKNFNQVINSYRISHACSILEQSQEKVNFEELAFASGFNTRISFNRNFKKEKGCSPSEYLNSKPQASPSRTDPRGFF